VSGTGLVTGVGAGSAQVNVTATLLDTGGKASATVSVTVRAAGVVADAGAPDVSSADGSAAEAGTKDAGPSTRDARAWPFTSNSIWNMPIGSGAQYVPTGIPMPAGGPNDWTPMPDIDLERIVLHPEAPLLTVAYSDAAWTGASRCSATGSAPSWTGLPVQVPVPASYFVPSDGRNDSAPVLLADGHTILEMQPFTRCAGSSTATALLAFTQYPIDLYGDGTYGSHGGSGLSGLGGDLRVGELLTAAPRHAVKIDLDYTTDYGTCTKADATCRASVQDACCYRWPAYGADSFAVGGYGASNPGQTKAMRMGSLLAIPASTDIAGMGLETAPGKMLAWTLQNYGAYIVDSGPTGAGVVMCTEDGPDGAFNATFQAHWGYPFNGRARDASGTSPNAAFVRDFQRLIAALQVVVNNGPNSIGGGGTPRQPLAPAL
jgi:hypothetical protein